ncbi:MAG: site-specific DNA-methyltransferase [Balneolaceae bacterium]
MQNLLNDLKQALEKDENLLVEGQLSKPLIEQKALSLDKEFLKLILNSRSLKEHFFEDMEETLVFDKNLLYVNYSEIDAADFEVSNEDKKLNHIFYGLKK